MAGTPDPRPGLAGSQARHPASCTTRASCPSANRVLPSVLPPQSAPHDGVAAAACQLASCCDAGTMPCALHQFSARSALRRTLHAASVGLQGVWAGPAGAVSLCAEPGQAHQRQVQQPRHAPLPRRMRAQQTEALRSMHAQQTCVLLSMVATPGAIRQLASSQRLGSYGACMCTPTLLHPPQPLRPDPLEPSGPATSGVPWLRIQGTCRWCGWIGRCRCTSA